MKTHNLFSTVILFMVYSQTSSQTFGDPTNFRPNPTVKQENLNKIKFFADLSPHFWESMHMAFSEREKLDENRKAHFALGYYAYPLGGYQNIVDLVKVSIAVRVKGKMHEASASGEELSDEQKKLILAADMGSDIGISLQFRHKDLYKINMVASEIVTAWTTITIVPHVEAEFPGGNTGAAEFISKHLIKRMSQKDPQVTVTFEVNEDGKVVDAKLTNTKHDSNVEKLLEETVAKMPIWKPAKNSNGASVKQQFNFQFGGGGC